MEPESIGPLPQSDRADDLQILSFRAFENAFPVARFRIRTEPGKDQGVDRYIEVKVGGCDTNCRSQVQLKSNDLSDYNQDGSISCSIRVRNLNYLCNGPCPIYILYLADTGQLRFVWARDEIRQITERNENWREQETVTLRFSRILDSDALDEIHARILQEVSFERRIHETLSRSSHAETVTIQITRENLNTTDPQQIRNHLVTSGMTIVASGFASEVARMYGALNDVDRHHAKIQLVHGYAQYMLSDYFAAQSSISRAIRSAHDLSSTDHIWLRRIRSVCDLRLGLINREEYLRREEEIVESLSGLPALEHRLEILRHRHIAARDIQNREELQRELAEVVTEILNHPDSSPTLRAAARIAELYSAGQECVVHSLIAIQMTGMSCDTTENNQPKILRQAILNRWSEWNEQMRSVCEEAESLNHPILIADALYTNGGIRHAACFQEAIGREMFGMVADGNMGRIETAIDFLEDAVELYAASGCIESQLRAKILIADLHEMRGNNDAARQVAQEVLPDAEALRFSTIEQHAREHLDGDTPFLRMITRFRRRPETP